MVRNLPAALLSALATLAPAPVRGAPTCRVTAVAGGGEHTAAIDADGSVWTWGYATGQGQGHQLPWPAPLAGPADVVEVTAGGYHILARTGDGSMWAWGDDCRGGLGDGPPLACPAVDAPIPVSGPGSWAGLDACTVGAFSLGLAADGTVWWWGAGPGYEIVPAPVQVPSLAGATAVAAGGQASKLEAHGLAVVAGTVQAWGNGEYGALGDGTEVSSPTPVQVLGLTGVVAVAAGYQYSLALRDDGTVWAWGLNDHGQLGDGTQVSASIPLPVNLPAAATAISTGEAHSLALLADGTVMAWGWNHRGQLGDGTTADSSVPLLVPGLAGVTAIDAAGSNNSFAVLADGSLWVWGFYDYGVGLGRPPSPRQTLLMPTWVDFDAIPPDQGNILRVSRQGDDALLDWEAGLTSAENVRASLWRVHADAAKDALGTTPIGADTTDQRFLDAGALARPGLEFYRIRGLSRCTETPGP